MKQEIAKLLYSLRVRLVLLVIVALIPVLGLFLYRGEIERREAMVHAEQDAVRLVHVVRERERQLFEGTRQLLQVVVQMPAVRVNQGLRCQDLLAGVLQEHPHFLNFGVIDLDGSVLCSALPFDARTNLGDRSYFRRALETRDFSVGDYQVGRITGKPSINFGFPITSDDGDVLAVAFAAMDLSWLRRLAVSSVLSPETVLTIVDGNGTILARTVDSKRWVGKPIPDKVHLDALLEQGEGTINLTDVDGVDRLCAFAPLSDTGDGRVFVSAGIPTREVFATIDAHWARDVIAFMLVCLFSVVAAWFGGNAFIARRVRQLVEVTRRLAEGDLDARAKDAMDYGRDEISDLARGLDSMAEAMSYRTGQLRRTQNDLMSAVEATIEGWARALERRDSDTQGHTRRVAELSVRLARAMNVPESDIVHIRRGALLHDIGKMGIPDSILLKPGPLTDDEWVVMRRHPTYAYEWLSHIPLLKPALEIPYAHHERWDGSGYPRGLVGAQIPLAARIFAVVDVFDGVTSDRPYRDAWSEERALEYIAGHSGTLFDADVVDAFLALIKKAPPPAEVVYHRTAQSETAEQTEPQLTS